MSSLTPDQHPIGMGEITDGRAFTQELRVGVDNDLGIGSYLTDLPLDLPAVPTRKVDLVTIIV